MEKVCDYDRDCQRGAISVTVRVCERERLLFADFTCPPSVRDLREREILPIYG